MEPSFRQDIYQGLQQAVRQGSEGVSALDLGEAGSVNKGPVLGGRGKRARHRRFRQMIELNHFQGRGVGLS